MKIKTHIKCNIDITTDEGAKICTLESDGITFPDKGDVLSIKAAYYVVSYTPDTDVFQQFTITAKCSDYYYDCTINTTTGNKSLLVRDSYHNVILTIDGNILKEAIDNLFKLKEVYK